MFVQENCFGTGQHGNLCHGADRKFLKASQPLRGAGQKNVGHGIGGVSLIGFSSGPSLPRGGRVLRAGRAPLPPIRLKWTKSGGGAHDQQCLGTGPRRHSGAEAPEVQRRPMFGLASSRPPGVECSGGCLPAYRHSRHPEKDGSPSSNLPNFSPNFPPPTSAPTDRPTQSPTPTHLSTRPPANRPTNPPTYQPTHLPTFRGGVGAA